LALISISLREREGTWYGAAYEEPRVFGTTFDFNREDALKGLLQTVPFDSPFQSLPASSAFADNVLSTVEKVYAGKDTNIEFSLGIEHLSSFRRKVMEATLMIPVGYVTSYGALALVTNGSPRAVGHVMATNPLAPIVPCHRVVAADFTLGGYGGGLKVKLEFLKREKRGHKSEQAISVGGRRLKVFPVEFVLNRLKNYCL
jgi:methylated-DNA-[protein]-cysteine S-methyltransferase